MNKNTLEFVLVTFLYDYAQFYLLCLSIKKYHNKQYKIRIIYQNDNDRTGEKWHRHIVQEHLKDFDVEFNAMPLEFFGREGWVCQQLLKWHLAYTSTADWQVVLDSKNFYIHPFDIDRFDRIPGFAIPNGDIDNWSNRELDKSIEFLKSKNVQRYAAMTPWIWKTAEVRDLLDKIWPNMTWNSLKELPGTEWFLYLANLEDRIKYYPAQLVSGIWGVENSNVMPNPKTSSIRFWVHHRFARTEESISATEQVLKKFNIANEDEIKQWKYYLDPETAVFIKTFPAISNI